MVVNVEGQSRLSAIGSCGKDRSDVLTKKKVGVALAKLYSSKCLEKRNSRKFVVAISGLQ